MSTIREIYNKYLNQLNNSETEEINLRILLCKINNINSMSEFFIHLSDINKDDKSFDEWFKQYKNGEPVAYIINETEFLGYKIYVDKNVLIPRPETEELVMLAKNKIFENINKKSVILADICCGSGCIGIAAQKLINCEQIHFSDISKDAINVTKKNIELNKSRGVTYVGDSLEELIKNGIKVDVILANPPYIINKDDADENVINYEPHLALFTTPKLDVYRSIITNVYKVKQGVIQLFFEIGEDNIPYLKEIMDNSLKDYEYEFIKDINSKYRFLYILVR